MKKNISIACNAFSLLIILGSLNIGYYIMTFLFAGIIPGTDITLSATQMLVLMTVLASLVVTRVGILPLIKKYNIANVTTNSKRSKITPKKLSRA